MSRIFHPCIFDRPVFSCLAFSVAPTEAQQAGRLVKKQSVKQASKIRTSQLLFIGLVSPYDPA